MKPEHLLGWGDPIVVRQALLETLDDFYNVDIHSLGYPPHAGNPKLIEQLKDQAERNSGHRPKHLLVTCGATGAVNAALHALSKPRTDWVVTNSRYYPIYPAIINMTDMIQISRARKTELIVSGLSERNFISLVDSPSNPDGSIFPFEAVDIWDAAYATRTYSRSTNSPHYWRIMCGSLSKILGLPGLRLGWASTDDDELYASMDKYVTSTYVGLSAISMSVAEKIFDRLDQHKFEVRSSAYLDHNREEMQKVLTKFGQGDVPSRGMFAILRLGKTEKKALEKANVKWQPGSSWGEDDSFARLSLGQTREVVRSAVKGILK
jgi:aspartate/methionine/tyrosine aminotransferase